MAAQQMYMFPEERIAKLEIDLNNLRRGLYARVTEVEKNLKEVSTVCEGNTVDFIEIRSLLEETKEAII